MMSILTNPSVKDRYKMENRCLPHCDKLVFSSSECDKFKFKIVCNKAKKQHL